jgi:hypothetical protein
MILSRVENPGVFRRVRCAVALDWGMLTIDSKSYSGDFPLQARSGFFFSCGAVA